MAQGKTFICIAIVLLGSVIVGFAALDPLWTGPRPPYEGFPPTVQPAIFAPADGPFYLRNAEQGYSWETQEPTSLWFHPLASAVAGNLPNWFATKTWFWLFSLACAIPAIYFTLSLLRIYDPRHGDARWLFAFPLIPAGLSVATGSPEVMTLCFSGIVVVGALNRYPILLIFISGILASLTKPNSIYLLGPLLVYWLSVQGQPTEGQQRRAFAGIVGVVLGLVGWMIFVDVQTGDLGSYLSARQVITGRPGDLFGWFADALFGSMSLQNRIRILSGVLMPLWVLTMLLFVRFSEEVHRWALAAGFASIFFVEILTGSPNKIVVYSTQIPGFFTLCLMLIQQSRDVLISDRRALRGTVFVGAVAVSFAFFLALYVIGTPRAWYY